MAYAIRLHTRGWQVCYALSSSASCYINPQFSIVPTPAYTYHLHPIVQLTAAFALAPSTCGTSALNNGYRLQESYHVRPHT